MRCAGLTPAREPSAGPGLGTVRNPRLEMGTVGVGRRRSHLARVVPGGSGAASVGHRLAPGAGEGVRGGVDVLLGGAAAEGEADGAERGLGVEAHGGEDGAGAFVALVAGGAGGGGDLGGAREDGGCAGVGEAHVDGVGQALRGVAVEREAGDGPFELLPEQVAQPLHALGFVVEGGAGEVCGGGEAYDAGDVLGVGPEAVFVAGAAQEGFEVGALADVEGADAFGGVELVSGAGQQVDMEVVDVEGDLACALGGAVVQGGFELV